MFGRKKSIYVYPGTDVLKNKLNIKDFEKLQNIEREIASVREADIDVHPISGDYGLDHMKAIHKKLFSDIYDWAGTTRMTNITKAGSSFCDVNDIEMSFDKLHKQLKQDRYLKFIMSKDELSDSLSRYYSEVNRIHPFREGNGRTQRIYFRQMISENLCYDLDFSNVTREQMTFASKEAMSGNITPMRDMMLSSLYRKGSLYKERECFLPIVEFDDISMESEQQDGEEYE